MCRCDKPTRNDEMDDWSKWRGREAPPPVQSGEEIVFDEPGRCRPQVNGTGSIDYHSHHFRLVRGDGSYALLVRHGGGDRRVDLGQPHTRIVDVLGLLDSDARYLMMHAIYSVQEDAARKAAATERERWMKAAAEKRIKTRKERGGTGVKVWIE